MSDFSIDHQDIGAKAQFARFRSLLIHLRSSTVLCKTEGNILRKIVVQLSTMPPKKAKSSAVGDSNHATHHPNGAPSSSAAASAITPATLVPTVIAATPAPSKVEHTLADKYKQLQQLTSKASVKSDSASADRDKKLEEAKAIWKAKQHQKQQQQAADVIATIDATVAAAVVDTVAVTAATVQPPPPRKAPTARSSKALKRAFDDDGDDEQKKQDNDEFDYVPGTVYVAGLPPFIEAEDVGSYFGHIGPIDTIRLMSERHFAFIRFQSADPQQAKAIVETCVARMHGIEIQNYRLKVSRARSNLAKLREAERQGDVAASSSTAAAAAATATATTADAQQSDPKPTAVRKPPLDVARTWHDHDSVVNEEHDVYGVGSIRSTVANVAAVAADRAPPPPTRTAQPPQFRNQQTVEQPPQQPPPPQQPAKPVIDWGFDDD